MIRPLAVLLLLTIPAQSASKITVVDGDTITYGRSKVRLYGIDTPEIHRNIAKCDDEVVQGLAAKARLEHIVSQGGITVRWHKGRDKYGRSLGTLYSKPLTINVNEKLVQEGLAKPYKGRGPKPTWCIISPNK